MPAFHISIWFSHKACISSFPLGCFLFSKEMLLDYKLEFKQIKQCNGSLKGIFAGSFSLFCSPLDNYSVYLLMKTSLNLNMTEGF